MWNFETMSIEEAEDATKPNLEPLPVGDYRLRIESTEMTVSNTSGLPMIKIVTQVSGTNRKIFSYIVLDENNKKRTDANLTILFDSFGIKPTMNIETWVGKVGGGHLNITTYNGKDNNKLGYFIKRSEVDKLPPWSEPASKSQSAPVTAPWSRPENKEDVFDDLEEILKG
ncbi:MAG: DUF669 domain-containing protein [Candidatus Methanomethylophilaceae archaeon]